MIYFIPEKVTNGTGGDPSPMLLDQHFTRGGHEEEGLVQIQASVSAASLAWTRADIIPWKDSA